ncbi:MAG: M20/M25/M40 family metallo-hydrolase [Proteobacteria bacterium]|nr:M20/M25/M40 family metallo-hydrolase [Pseudomonadota bacterium]
MKRVLLAVVVLVAALAAVLVINTAHAPAVTAEAGKPAAPVAVDSAGAIARFAKALTFPTISWDPGTNPTDSAAFRGLQAHLAESFPLVHKTLKHEVVNHLSLLYTWPGSDPSLAPVVLMGHQDVVPVIPGTESRWQQPPFGGVVTGGYVWGRGALDDKLSVLGTLEAIETLLRAGFQPKHTVYLAFGHDEEIGGEQGAKVLRDTLVARGLKKAALVLDEGGAIASGAMLGVSGKVALIGVSEKGFLSLELSVKGEGGHSSDPPAHTAIGHLATVIEKVEGSPFPATLDGPTRWMMDAITPLMPFSKRLAMSNLWLFGPMVQKAMLASPQSAAMLRTTTAVTMVNGGVKTNVLPIDAKAVVNFRIRPGETMQSVTERIRQIVNDSSVTIKDLGFHTDPSPVSDPNGAGFKALAKSVRDEFGATGVTITPYLVIGGTDSRYWSGLSSQTFRFVGAPFEADGLTRVHGTGERAPVGAYVSSVRYLVRLVRNTDDIP